MSPITVIFWQLIALLLLGMCVCGLLVLFLDRLDDVRQARAERDNAVAEARQARADLRDLHARYEALADEASAQQQVIEAFIPPDAYTAGDQS